MSDPLASIPQSISDLDDLQTQAGLRGGQVVLSRFKLERCLGRGGMGEVWLADDKTLDQKLALKLLPRMIHFDPKAVDDLKNETRRGRQLSHPNIVRVFDFYQDPDNVGIAMEFVDGENLGSLHAREHHGVFSADAITGWTRQLLMGLDYAHRTENVVHRDLKPANLLIDKTTGNLKIADFGIARCLADSMQRMTVSAQSRGTLCYMSPEQATGRGANPLDDLYAVGATLYQLLAGTPPFYSGDVFSQILKVPPSPIAERQQEQGFLQPPPAHWEAAIMRCLEKERAKRPQSALEVLDLLGLRTGDLPAPTPYVMQTPGVSAATAQVFGGHTAPPAATLPVGTTGPFSHTGPISVSTSAPVRSLLPSATQRTIDLTQTGTHGAAATGTAQTAQGQEKKKGGKGVLIAAVAVPVLLAAGGAVLWSKRTETPQPQPASTPTQTQQSPAVAQTPTATPTAAVPAGATAPKPQEVPAAADPALPAPGTDWRVPGHFATIQAAINAAKQEGQKIYVGERQWNENLTIKTPVRLVGAGSGKSIVAVDGRSGAALEIRAVKGVVIEGLGFSHKGDDALTGGGPTVFVEGGEVTFQDCAFTRAMGDGLTASGSATKVTLTKCSFVENIDAGLKATAAAQVDATGCTFDKNDFGIVAELTGSKVKVKGSTFTGQAKSGIEASDHAQVTVSSSMFNTNKEVGVYAHDSGTSASLDDCDLIKSDYGIKAIKGAALNILKSRVRENIIGMVFESPGNVEVRENLIEGNSEDGIVLFAEVKAGAALIYNNTVKANRIGMNIHGAGMAPDVAGNDLGPNAFPDIYLHGKAAGNYSKNTLRSAERFLAEQAGADDPGAGAYQWAADNVEKPENP